MTDPCYNRASSFSQRMPFSGPLSPTPVLKSELKPWPQRQILRVRSLPAHCLLFRWIEERPIQRKNSQTSFMGSYQMGGGYYYWLRVSVGANWSSIIFVNTILDPLPVMAMQSLWQVINRSCSVWHRFITGSSCPERGSHSSPRMSSMQHTCTDVTVRVNVIHVNLCLWMRCYETCLRSRLVTRWCMSSTGSDGTWVW